MKTDHNNITMDVKVSKFEREEELQLRPNASSGLWLHFLLPAVIIVSSAKNPIILTINYKCWTVLSVGFILTSALFIYKIWNLKKLEIFSKTLIISGLFTSFVFYVSLETDLFFSIFGGVCSTVLYYKLYLLILKYFPLCFTFGEASIVTQGLVLFSFSLFLNITNALQNSLNIQMQMSTLIIQMGLLAVAKIAFLSYKFQLNQASNFYIITVLVVLFTIVLPLNLIFQKDPVLWIVSLITEDVTTLKLVLYWSFCSLIAALSVGKQILNARKASTSIRKVFHILAVVVFIPGLIHRCSFLYLASGVILGIFVALELLRILDIPPLSKHLQDGFIVFSDEKDTGILALTPIYLLTGCSIPLWIHPAPCDVTNSASFSLLPLLSGLLSIGIGDTAASVVGSTYGIHKWKSSKKSIEGTLACILCQCLFIGFLIYMNCLQRINTIQLIKIGFAVITVSLIEAKTNQVDNLTLPLIMYLILI